MPSPTSGSASTFPRGETTDLTRLQHPEFAVRAQRRHGRKLRPGDLQGNHFRIVLRNVAGEHGAVEARLQAVASQGAPNYFGGRRFGFEGGNVEHGRPSWRAGSGCTTPG